MALAIVASVAMVPLSARAATAPDAPTNVVATGGNRSAAVSWTAPASDGGSPITSYTVTPLPADVTVPPVTSGTATTVTGLTNGTSYTFTVTASNSIGPGPPSTASNAVVPAATVPDPPTNVVATAGNGSAGVIWTAPASDGGSAITSYTATSSPGGISSTPVSGTSATVSGLTNGTSYTFTVVATNAVGSGLPSTPSNAVTPATVPDPPTNVVATAGNGSAGVSWTPPVSDGGSPITGYTVTSSPGSISAGAAGNATTATVGGLANGTTYTFTVTAANSIGSGAASTPSNPVTPLATVPDPPTNVVATAGNASAGLSWTAPAFDGGSPITSYTVSVSPADVIVPPVTSGTSTAVTGLTNGTSYTFTVTATNSVGSSAASAASNAVIPAATVPDAPTSVVATGGNASATVSWTAPASDGGSAITSYTVTSSPAVTIPPVTSGTSTTVTGLTNGTSYTFTVTATNSVGTSAASAPSNSVTPAATVPDAPTNVVATGGNGSATVSWTAPVSDGGSAITSYTVTSSPAVTIPPVTSGTSTTVTGLTNGTAYTFTVTATNAIGTGPASAPSSSVTPGPTVPDAPTNVVATGGPGSAIVTWTAPASDGGSAITSYTVTPLPADVTVPPVTGTSTTVTGLTNGTSYTFTVTANNNIGAGAASTPSNAVIPAAKPDMVTNVQAVAGNAAVKVTWAAANANGSPITNYEIDSTGGDGLVLNVAGDVLTVTFTGLTNGHTYHFVVFATNSVGTSPQSLFSNAVIPNVPTVSSLIPNTGPYDGGTSVKITGTNFSSATTVFFGANQATNVVIVRPTVITVTSPAGSGTVDVRVNVLNGITPISLADKFTYTITCLKATVDASPVSPSAIGIPVTFTAHATGCPAPNFVFWLQYPDRHWVLKQNWGPNPQWTWHTTGLPAGIYNLHVGATQAGYPQTSFQALGPLQFTLSGCTSAGLTPDNPSPQLVGTRITFTATSLSCLAPRYEFWLGYPNGTWVMRQAFSANLRTWAWDTTGYPLGTYKVHVWANQAGDPMVTFETFAEYAVILTGCTAVSLTPATFAQPAGAPLDFTANPLGCATPLFEFWVGYPNGTWVMRQPFSHTATFSWKTAGLAPGRYSIHVWANQQGGSLATWQANGAASVSLNICTSATISPVHPTGAAGALVNMSASSTDCANPRYAYWIQYPNGTWIPARAFGAADFSWNTAGLAPGTYPVHVWANNLGDSQKSWEAWGGDTVTLTGCTTATANPDFPSPRPVGTTITFTATADLANCPNPVFAFWLQYPDKTWHLMQGFTPSVTTWQWRTSGFPKGNYVLHVWANNQGSKYSTYETFFETTFTLT